MTSLDPRIGQLNSGKYYCFADGYRKPEFVGTLDQVQARLHSRAAGKPVRPSREVHNFDVTIAPRQIVYAGSWRSGVYTVRVQATTHAQAISKARAARRLEEGRFAMPASFSARRSRD